jgi:hypothetical protein
MLFVVKYSHCAIKSLLHHIDVLMVAFGGVFGGEKWVGIHIIENYKLPLNF